MAEDLNLKTVNTVDTRPFKKLVMTIGELPTSFVESMTYYELLAWFTNYLETVIIPTVNNNGEAVEELQDKFIDLKNATEEEIAEFEENITILYNQLKSYVDNYFDNLDVQSEIDHKLDEMVTDGTMEQIINQEIFSDITNAIGDITKLETVNKGNLVEGVNCANRNHIDYYRRKYGCYYKEFTDKGGVSYFDNVKIYRDIYDNSFTYNIDIESYKLIGGNTIYVNPNSTEAPSSQTGSLDHPFNSIKKAYDIASDNDTIALFGGIYYRNNLGFGSSSHIEKSLNFIPYNNGKVYLSNADKLTFTVNASYDNVYQATRSNTTLGIDMRLKDKGIFPTLTKVDSLTDCHNTLNSYCQDGSTVYVNIGEEPTSEKVIFPLNLGFGSLQIYSNTANMRVYMENLTCIGGDHGIWSITSTSGFDCEVIANNCNFYFATGEDQNAINVLGANTIFYNCKACYGNRDGFNYHKQGGKICNSIEIDCVGAYNGITSAQNNNNGSTTHDGNKCLRINGVYFDNKGGNVTDVQTNTYSLNINCVAFDSKSSGTTSKGDFVAQQAGVTMDLYNCYSKGSSSYVNIYGVEDTTLNVHNCIADNVYSEGTLNVD